MTPIETPNKKERSLEATPQLFEEGQDQDHQNQEDCHHTATEIARPFEPSDCLSNHLMHDCTGGGYASADNHRRSVTEVYGTKTKHIVESLR